PTNSLIVKGFGIAVGDGLFEHAKTCRCVSADFLLFPNGPRVYPRAPPEEKRLRLFLGELMEEFPRDIVSRPAEFRHYLPAAPADFRVILGADALDLTSLFSEMHRRMISYPTFDKLLSNAG